MKSGAIDRAIAQVEGVFAPAEADDDLFALVLLDLCVRVAKRVSAFTMELIPGLRSLSEPIVWAEARFGIKIVRYPHWLRAVYDREGVYCFHAKEERYLDINDIYMVARADAGCQLIVTGAKSSDSLWRRRTGAMKFAGNDLKAPLWDWNSRDVFGYLKARSLPIPTSDGRQASGVDLTQESVCFLHDNFPDDFKRLERVFPFIRSRVLRRDWFGYDPSGKRKASA